jgi:hypothetical protein
VEARTETLTGVNIKKEGGAKARAVPAQDESRRYLPVGTQHQIYSTYPHQPTVSTLPWFATEEARETTVVVFAYIFREVIEALQMQKPIALVSLSGYAA